MAPYTVGLRSGAKEGKIWVRWKGKEEYFTKSWNEGWTLYITSWLSDEVSAEVLKDLKAIVMHIYIWYIINKTIYVYICIFNKSPMQHWMNLVPKFRQKLYRHCFLPCLDYACFQVLKERKKEREGGIPNESCDKYRLSNIHNTRFCFQFLFHWFSKNANNRNHSTSPELIFHWESYRALSFLPLALGF